MSDYRIEEDTLGPVKVPVDALWGAQTQRSLQNFSTGEKIPLVLIKVLLQLKKASAVANEDAGAISSEKATLIVTAINQLLSLDDDQLRKDFPLVVYQTGSGTQTNMNVNEVVANMAKRLNSKVEILPNDDVNHGQSSNDIFPTAMNITAAFSIEKLENAVQHLIDKLAAKQKEFWQVVKIGRTHLQDATPITFGQEISGWKSMLEHDLRYLKELSGTLNELAIGGTAVGTGLNAAPHFAEQVAQKMSAVYGIDFTADTNKFYGLAAHSSLNVVHGAMKTLASDLIKIANDVRFLASGPRAGYGEIRIPANEPGSSIMPGKVNPTQAEAITMAAVRVIGNDVVISLAASQGNFEMNVYKPVIISTFLESATLLTGTMTNFTDLMIAGLTVNQDRMKELVDRSLMMVTALSPHIGYHASAKIAQQAQKDGSTLRQAAIQSGKVTAKQYDAWVDPVKMTGINKQQK
ncbi:class II fumarate hydratase [Pediococcus ethanolidurans]|uniref:class II fumarate hydratase n=1 Tax=Pediococcus ethanolidurans TaxID=319653 RepID=UPI001C1EFFE2|nr:class II fumarate hydratase [Pediococcus ethanolidurans]MBU7555138.1 class II fumarate hydratase [Pediococcus ethanolidurans]MCV3315563.1 class II fumarate hydratase [Pediococcus ethanolidurans]MCV3321564.1 class II fumarate hydratase [Pediococcus ethanolidurans]MCV3323784.1 class II fumarate hydratase [Pediococcus ethanolidurans]MCV3328012.1 class II fumarate hydratase [Pediococcus ethanolidurans]